MYILFMCLWISTSLPIYIVLCIHTYIWLHIVTYIYTHILYGIVADSLLFPCFFHPFCFIFSPIFFHTTSLPSSVRGFLIVSVPFPLLANLISLCFLTLVYCPFNFCGNHTCFSVVVAMPFFSLLPVSFILGFLAFY